MFIVLTQYYNCLSKVSKAYSGNNERVENLIASYQPEQDIKVLIERSRTGPFRPVAQVYESIAHDESDVVFGIDLRKWADSAYWNVTSPGEKKEDIPPLLTSLFAALAEAYPKLPNDAGLSFVLCVEVAYTDHPSREAQNLDLRGPVACGASPS